MNDSEKIAAIKKELEDVEEYDSLEEAVCTLRRIVNIAYAEFDWDAYADELANSI